jgi:hypothetical protein
MPTKSKSSKKGGATFGYVEQFNYPLSPCYKNQAKAGWHSGGDGSCAKKTVEGLTPSENEISGGGFFDWIMGKEDKKKSTSTSGKKKKSTSSSTTDKKKKSSSTGAKKKPSKK